MKFEIPPSGNTLRIPPSRGPPPGTGEPSPRLATLSALLVGHGALRVHLSAGLFTLCHVS